MKMLYGWVWHTHTHSLAATSSHAATSSLARSLARSLEDESIDLQEKNVNWNKTVGKTPLLSHSLPNRNGHYAEGTGTEIRRKAGDPLGPKTLGDHRWSMPQLDPKIFWDRIFLTLLQPEKQSLCRRHRNRISEGKAATPSVRRL